MFISLDDFADCMGKLNLYWWQSGVNKNCLYISNLYFNLYRDLTPRTSLNVFLSNLQTPEAFNVKQNKWNYENVGLFYK